MCQIARGTPQGGNQVAIRGLWVVGSPKSLPGARPERTRRYVHKTGAPDRTSPQALTTAGPVSDPWAGDGTPSGSPRPRIGAWSWADPAEQPGYRGSDGERGVPAGSRKPALRTAASDGIRPGRQHTSHATPHRFLPCSRSGMNLVAAVRLVRMAGGFPATLTVLA